MTGSDPLSRQGEDERDEHPPSLPPRPPSTVSSATIAQRPPTPPRSSSKVPSPTRITVRSSSLPRPTPVAASSPVDQTRDHNATTLPHRQPQHPLPDASSSHQRRQSMNETIEIVDTALHSVADSVRREITAATQEYNLLHTLTSVAQSQYSSYNLQAQSLIKEMAGVQQQYEEIDRYVHQIFDLERQVSSMEQVVGELDAYTKEIEAVLKKRGRQR
ncbi:biogenesis of lysosome-related organelles complex-1 subunit 2-domain-containing protein [Gaertneriomyces semiglobifer]|nr:biogenesis of lysosome-related organelles complex-1 subunit 2-domain-containing protein [Gaertneriomyces semiglobifer]